VKRHAPNPHIAPCSVGGSRTSALSRRLRTRRAPAVATGTAEDARPPIPDIESRKKFCPILIGIGDRSPYLGLYAASPSTANRRLKP
jgi:hypothetical protein